MSIKSFFSSNKPSAPLGFVEPTYFLWLGDSITLGANATSDATAFRGIVSNHYGAAFDIGARGGAVVDPDYGGLPDNGYSLKYYQKNFANSGIYTPGRYVFFAFGTNDYGPFDAEWKSRYKAIVVEIIGYGWNPNQLLFGTPPYQSLRPYSPQCVTYTHEIADELGCLFVDLYAPTLAAGGDALLDTDGIHPLNSGHAVMGNTINNYLDSL